MALTNIPLYDNEKPKKDYDKRVEYLKDIGLKPIPFNGNTISGQYFDYNSQFSGYSSLDLPFNVMQYNTWKAKDTKDINDGFLRLINDKFKEATKTDLINLTERYIIDSKQIADKFEKIDLEQAQFWGVHNKWLKEVLNELKTISTPENLQVLPVEIVSRFIARRTKEFNIDIDVTIGRIKTRVKIEVAELKAKIKAHLFRFPEKTKAIYDEYSTELETEYKDLKFVFNKTLFDTKGEFIKDALFRELQMVYAYPNANLNEFIDNGIKQLATIAKIEFLKELKSETPTPIEKHNNKLKSKKISFNKDETIEKLHSELKGYFPNKEAELLKVLQGDKITELLLFPHNQNKFVEVIRRLKYNGFLLNNDTEIKNWICSTFNFKKKGFSQPQPFNENTVWDTINKGKGEPTKKERICIADWLPYKSTLQLSREAEKEKL